jgi:uncharacterized membrane protein
MSTTHASPGATTQHHHPTVLAEAEKRSADIQLRIADAITSFAGSMPFVYIHAVVFALWMLFFEKSPWPTLTLIVSLEAIFLSTFVMIGQNRQAAFQQAKADHDFDSSETELHLNTDLTRTIHQLTMEIHSALNVPDGTSAQRPPSEPVPPNPVPPTPRTNRLADDDDGTGDPTSASTTS